MTIKPRSFMLVTLVPIILFFQTLSQAQYNAVNDKSERSTKSAYKRIKISNGTGSFKVKGGTGHNDDTIKVFFYKPENFDTTSNILFVIPGSGRDGDEYRDAWIESAEKYNVLVLSLMYPEEDYDFGQYHMGGLMYDLQLKGNVTYADHSNEVFLDEENFNYKVNANKESWLFNDFDRIFKLVVEEVESAQSRYDIFGHSAGGQILHRFVLFNPESKADRILASNSGFYTLPVFNNVLPFGLKNTPVNKEGLKKSFENKLILFIGEEDNEHETGGILLRSPSANQQGDHRLARSKYFYEQAKLQAGDVNADLNWTIEIIPEIGHDFRKMSNAAAEYLYKE